MIRVVEAISDTNIGGAGVLLLNRLSKADRRIFDVTVMLPQNSLLTERFRDIGIRTVEIDGKGDASFSVRKLFGQTSALKKIKPHIINSHGDLSSRIAATIVGVPARVYTRHCTFPVSGIYDFLCVRVAVKIMTNVLSHRVIAVAYAVKGDLIRMGVSPSKIKVIINGSNALGRLDEAAKNNIKRKNGISENDVVVTICARLEPCKGHKCFLKAAKILSEGERSYKFLILGSGSTEKELKMLVRYLGIDKNVIFTGFVKDVSPYMNITDINVNCSVGTETSSLALSEGMSLGIPAVVSNYGGNPYMVRHGANGYVYEKENAQELANYIERIANSISDGEYAKISTASRKRFEQELNSEVMTRKTETLYLELIKNKRPMQKDRS